MPRYAATGVCPMRCNLPSVKALPSEWDLWSLEVLNTGGGCNTVGCKILRACSNAGIYHGITCTFMATIVCLSSGSLTPTHSPALAPPANEQDPGNSAQICGDGRPTSDEGGDGAVLVARHADHKAGLRLFFWSVLVTGMVAINASADHSCRGGFIACHHQRARARAFDVRSIGQVGRFNLWCHTACHPTPSRPTHFL